MTIPPAVVSISASGGVSSLSVFRKVVRLSVLCLCIIPTEAELLLAFLFGAALIILGRGLFSLNQSVNDAHWNQNRNCTYQNVKYAADSGGRL